VGIDSFLCLPNTPRTRTLALALALTLTLVRSLAWFARPRFDRSRRPAAERRPTHRADDVQAEPRAGRARVAVIIVVMIVVTIVCCMIIIYSSVDFEQLDVENQRGRRGNDARDTPRAVRVIGGARQRGTLPNLHLEHLGVPRFDHLADADGEDKRTSAVTTAVKFGAVCERARVVHAHSITRVRGRARSLNNYLFLCSGLRSNSACETET